MAELLHDNEAKVAKIIYGGTFGEELRSEIRDGRRGHNYLAVDVKVFFPLPCTAGKCLRELMAS